MGFELSVETKTYSGEDQSWLGSAAGTNNCDTITLDASAFLGTFPTGIVPSGVLLGKITATGLYAPYGASPSEVQTIGLGAATAGSVTITFDGETTAAIAFDAVAADVQAALLLLSNLNPGDVVASGGPFPGVVTLTFGGQYVGQNVPEITATPTGLTGGTVTIATTVQGGGAVSDGSEVAEYHLFTTTDLRGTTAGTAKDTVAAGFWGPGEVLVAKLPTGHGLDAAARVDMKHVKYVG